MSVMIEHRIVKNESTFHYDTRIVSAEAALLRIILTEHIFDFDFTKIKDSLTVTSSKTTGSSTEISTYTTSGDAIAQFIYGMELFNILLYPRDDLKFINNPYLSTSFIKFMEKLLSNVSGEWRRALLTLAATYMQHEEYIELCSELNNDTLFKALTLISNRDCLTLPNALKLFNVHPVHLIPPTDDLRS